jgi:hypothetical protein
MFSTETEILDISTKTHTEHGSVIPLFEATAFKISFRELTFYHLYRQIGLLL